MASQLPEPPPNVPRIAEVQSPASGHYVVLVRMPTQLAAKFPDKPWGTPIENIGLAKQDVSRFAGYELVDIEPVNGSPDLYWIFQKLPGPSWTTKSKGQDSLTPAKYRLQVETVQTKQEVDPETSPDEITGDLTSSVVQQQDDTGKAVKVNTEEVISELASPLSGKVAYEQRQVADVSEQLVADGTAAEEGLEIISSRVSPLGNGKSIKETVSVGSWVEHTGSKWDDELEAQIVFTEKFVDPPSPSDLALEHTSFEIVNEDRSLKIVQNVPTDALDTYLIRHPVRVDLSDLPRELIAIETVWNEGISIGEQDYDFYVWKSGSSFTVSKSANDSASSSSSVSCEVYLKYKDVATHNLFGERLFFYLPNNVTEANIIDKVNGILWPTNTENNTVDFWPVFRPESETLITTGQSVKVVANVQISLGATITDGSLTGQQWDKGTSDDYSANINASAVQIPPCIHGAIAIGGGTSRSRPVAVTAFMQMYNSAAGVVSATKTKTGTASASIYPTSLAPTSPEAIPTSGTYIMDMDVRKFKYGYSAVTVILFDASKLA